VKAGQNGLFGKKPPKPPNRTRDFSSFSPLFISNENDSNELLLLSPVPILLSGTIGFLCLFVSNKGKAKESTNKVLYNSKKR